MDKYDEFSERMSKYCLDKCVTIDILNFFVNGGDFLNHLNNFKDKETERESMMGVIYSEDYEKDDDGYFGENKVCFYMGDDAYDILDYSDMYMYLYFSCEFYIEKHPEEKEIVDEIFKEIEKVYNIE